MPRRLLIGLLLMVAAYGAVMVLLPNVSTRTATAYTCGPTAPNVAPAKLQIRVYGDRANEVNWAFNVSPNPFTSTGVLHVIDNQTPDIGLTRSDMLMEGVCTTGGNDYYTVSLDPAVTPPCPMVQTTLTQPAPLPTNPNSNPNTAAFYFTMQCPPPTPTPPPATPTPLPISAIITVSVTTSVTTTSSGGITTTINSNGQTTTGIGTDSIPCNGSALVTVRAFQGISPVPDGTPVQLSSTIGTLGQYNGITVGGMFQTPLNLPKLTSQQFGNVRATVGYSGAQAPAASFTAQACASDTLSSVSPPPPQAPVEGTILRPPNTGDAGLLSD